MAGEGHIYGRPNPIAYEPTDMAKKRYKLYEKWKKEEEAERPPEGLDKAIMKMEGMLEEERK